MTDIENKRTFHAEDEATLQLLDLWRLIWDHKIWYIVTVFLALCVAVFHIYRTPDTYSSTAKVLIDESSQDATMRNLGVASAGMMKMRGMGVDNEIEAFSSPDLMQTVVERLGLQTRYYDKQTLRTVEFSSDTPVTMVLAGDNPQSSFSFELSDLKDGQIALNDFKVMNEEVPGSVQGVLGDTLVTPVGSIALFPTENIEDFKNNITVTWRNSMSMAKSFCRNLSIATTSKESTVLVLSLQDNDPRRATSILNTLIDVYNEVWINNKNRSSINTAEFINERLVIIESELASIEEAIKQYKSSHNLTDVKAVAQSYLEESSLYATKAFEVNNQLSIAKYIKDYLNDPANSMSLIPANLGLQSSSADTQIKDYNELVLHRDRLIKGSGESNPLISDLNTSIAALRSAILRSMDNLIATLDLQLSKIQSQERQILSRMASSSGQELQLLSIERKQQITQELYMFLLQKREENELAALINVGNTRTIVNPNPSPLPIAPNKMMILLAAMVLGCGIPFAYFFLVKVLDTTVKNRGDLEGLTVPFLAEIPFYERPEVKKKKFKVFRNRTNDKLATRILVQQGSRDMMNEAFRVLRTNLDLMTGREKKCKVMMLTSFNPNAGKTFTIINLAASMALKNSKVLIIDLDLRKASLAKALGIQHSGVAGYLNGKVDDYRPYIDEVSPNLHVLPVGTLPPNPTELLLTDRFRDMIEQMRQEFDYIFLDCPPIDVVADASIITGVVDMTIFVMRARLMDKRVLDAVEELYQSGKYTHMTMLLNSVDMQYKKYGYGRSGYGYGYGYGYGHGSEE